MDKLKNADISNIKDFLAFDNTELKPKIVYQFAFGNILIPFLCILGIVASPLTWTVAIVELIAFIAFMVYFKVKIKPTQQQINLCYAINWMFMSVNMCYSSCVAFSQTNVNVFTPLLVYIVAVPLCVILMVKSACKKIIDGAHKGKKLATAIISSASMCGAALGLHLSRYIERLNVNNNMILGIISIFLAIIISLASTGVFIKWYCYSIVEKAENNSAIDKKQHKG